uniref:Uncharacterized protein n=1 Tax=Manihot esculenta TaxID=3983 RepID=A0A2C9V0H3_MANES
MILEGQNTRQLLLNLQYSTILMNCRGLAIQTVVNRFLLSWEKDFDVTCQGRKEKGTSGSRPSCERGCNNEHWTIT